MTGKLFHSIGIRLLLLTVSLATSILLARTLGPTEYGYYIFALAVTTLLAIPVQAGMPLLIVREVAKFDVRGEYELMKGFLLRALQTVVLLSALAIVGVLIISHLPMGLSMEFSGREVLFLAFILFPLVALGNIVGAMLRAFQHLAMGQLIETLLRPLLLLALLAAAFLALGWAELNAQLTMWMHIVAAIGTLATGLYLVLRHGRMPWHRITARYETRAWASSLLPLSLIAGMQIILSKTDIVMLRAMRAPDDVAFYYVAMQGGMLVFLANQAVNMVVGPILARLHAQGDRLQMQRVLSNGARFVFITTLPTAILLFVFGYDILAFFFGTPYVAAYGAMIVIAFGFIFQSLFGAIDALLKMTGWERIILRTIGFAVIANIGLNAILISAYGPLGAAIASVLTTLVWKAHLARQAHRRLGLVSFAFVSLATYEGRPSVGGASR